MEEAAEDVSSWIERVDQRTGRTYWGNLKTKKTTWREPDTVRRWRSGSTEDSFVEVVDEKTKIPYYVCQRTKLSTWIKPAGTIRPARRSRVVEDAKTEGTPSAAVKTHIATSTSIRAASSPVSEHSAREDVTWVECFDAKRQKAYYFNAESGKSTWSRPTSGHIIKATLWQQLKTKGRALKQRARQRSASLHDPSDPLQSATDSALEVEASSEADVTPKSASPDPAPQQHEKALAEPGVGPGRCAETADKGVSAFTDVEYSESASNTQTPGDVDPKDVPVATDAVLAKKAREEEVEEEDEDEIATAKILEDGSVEGSLSVQCGDQHARAPMLCQLRDGVLRCTPKVTSSGEELVFEMKTATNVHVHDDEEEQKEAGCASDAKALQSDAGQEEAALFSIRLESVAQTWTLGTNSIEDFQTWLEALQQQVRRARVTSLDSGEQGGQHPVPSGRGREPSALLQSRRKLQSTCSLRVSVGAQSSPRMLSHMMAPPLRGAADDAGGNGGAGDTIGASRLEAAPWMALSGRAAFDAWVLAHGFGAYTESFASAGYDDLGLLAGLTDADLKEMLEEHVEIAKPGHRMKVVLAVRKLRENLSKE